MIVRQVNLPNDSGTVTLHEEDGKYHIHRYAARGKINNTIANYEFIDDNNVSSLIPLDRLHGNFILDRIENGNNYSNVFSFYENANIVEFDVPEKSEEEH